MASSPSSSASASAARLAATIDIMKQLDTPGQNVETVLDAARAQLDAMSPAEVASIALLLLDWTEDLRVPSRKERCRLLSYSAIMHGVGLLPHLPPLLRSLVTCFGDSEEVSLRTSPLTSNV